ncbi:MAG: hypothetical protein GY898_14000 [Proteobacteria bacterium]|nr:hypothetical protein [Pseudomonadota bacterium]
MSLRLAAVAVALAVVLPGVAGAQFEVDEQEAGFAFIAGSSVSDVEGDSGPGGWLSSFYYRSPFSLDIPLVTGRWTPNIPQTGLYLVETHIPESGWSASSVAPFDTAFHGGHALDLVDLTPADHGWAPLNGGEPLKFLAGTRGHVDLSNLTPEEPEATVTWDALRFTFVAPAGLGLNGADCELSGDCSGTLICFEGECVPECTITGCTAPELCEYETGVCYDPTGGGDDDIDDPWWDPPPDQDTDGDGIPDADEGNVDSDGDGLLDWIDSDSDNDGIPDEVEGDIDTDGDGIPDYLDTDSDNDSIPDFIEVGPNPDAPLDTDGDGAPDYLDTDADGDGIPDEIEAGDDPNHPVDTDADGVPDYLDSDSDNDGLDDADEAGDDPLDPTDTDGDGEADFRETDSDGDGILDGAESAADGVIGDGDSVSPGGCGCGVPVGGSAAALLFPFAPLALWSWRRRLRR